MNFKDISDLDKATRKKSGDVLRLGLAMVFVVGIMFYTMSVGSPSPMLIASAVIGAYMAMNIGANDVANNVGPAVGSRALTMFGALAIAAIFEAGGALIAGGEVVGTIRSGIIDPSGIPDTDTFVWLMMAALLAGALWLNVATFVGAPVSTTHSIVGAVLGAGVAASGMDIANWGKMGTIAASWVISPVLGGLIAAAFLYLIKRSITYQQDMTAAAGRMVPILIALMVWTFSAYLMLKGLNQIWKVSFASAVSYSAVLAVLAYLVTRPLILRRVNVLENNKQSVNHFFTLPLIFAAALLSFAHGSNDVANAIGPLSAVAATVNNAGQIVAKSHIDWWVLPLGAVGIVLGLAAMGKRVMATVGTGITHLTPSRGFAAQLATASTVVIASGTGLPISTTQTLVGAIMGVGLARGIAAINLGVVRNIVISWVITLPAGALLAIVIFWALQGIFL